MENLGTIILQNRKKWNYNQQQLADEAGISRSYLCDIENNRYLPSIKTLRRLATALHMNFHFLLENDGNTSKQEKGS